MGTSPWASFLPWLLLTVLVSPRHVTSEYASRGLLQAKVKIDGAKTAAKVFQELESGQVVELDLKKLETAETLVVAVENIVIQGPPDGPKPVITCPPDLPALRISASQVTVQNVIFQGCKGEIAAVIVQPEGDNSSSEDLISSVLFSGVEFRKNEVTGFFAYMGCLAITQASVSIEDSVFSENLAALGAAISVQSGLLSVTNSIFTRNVAGEVGGAIYVNGQGILTQAKDGILSKGLSIDKCIFEGNIAKSDVPGSMITKRNGGPLEPLTFYTFPLAHGQGGAISIVDVAGVDITNSTFRGNQAPSGGALFLQLETESPESPKSKIVISNCTFNSNAAVFPEGNNDEEDEFAFEKDYDTLNGGAIFAVVGEIDALFSLEGSTFVDNTAQSGGGLHVVTSDTVEMNIKSCIFEKNTARRSGGAAVFRNLGLLSWSSSNVKDCTAEIGGGVLLTNNAKMILLGPDPSRKNNEHSNSVFKGNLAVDGAGMMCAMCGATTLQGPWFLQNKASRNGGGISVINAVTDMFVQEGKFDDNVAMRGGGAFIDTASHLRFYTNPAYEKKAPTIFRRNKAVSGGALLVIPRSLRKNKIEIIGVIFKENVAEELKDIISELEETRGVIKGSRNLLQDETPKEPKKMLVEDVSADCGSASGGGICLLLDRVPEASTVDVTLYRINFTGNSAGIGGGAYVSVEELEWKGTKCGGNSAPTSLPCRSFQLDEPNFVRNQAVYGGGALFVSDPTRVFIAKCGSPEVLRLDEVWRQERLEEFCLKFDSNQVQDGGVFGNNMASKGFSLQVSSASEELKNQTSGQRLQSIMLRVADAFNQTVTGGLPDAEVDVALQSTGVTGQLVYKASKGIINVNNSEAIGEHKSHTVVFSADRLQAANATFTIRDCYPGELQGEIFKECRQCSVNQYSFIPANGCLACENEAECRGGAALVPKPGWWHSTPYSPDFHECIIHEACEYSNRIETLTDFYSNFSTLTPDNRVQPNENYKQCSEGYRGVLCGSCEEDYGHFSGGECKKCRSSKITTLIVVAVGIWSALLVSFEIINSVSANRDFLKGVNASFLVGNRQEGSVPQESVTGPIVKEMTVIRHHSDGTAPGDLNQPIGAEIVIPVDVEAAENLTETVKIFTNYLQVTSLAVTINLSWEKVVRRLLQAQEILAGLSSGSTVVPLDCTFEKNYSIPRSILALWLRIMYPVILLLFFLLLVVLTWCVTRLRKHLRPSEVRKSSSIEGDALRNLDPHNLTTYCIIVTIAVSFFAYNGVTEELMRTINCLELEMGNVSQPPNPYQVYTVLPGGQVWAEDTSLTCFQGKHTVTGVFGILFLLLFSLGFIVFIVVLLLWNKDRVIKQDVLFLARYGFLYRAYRTNSFTIYWEAVVTLRKALIGAVVVYAYPLGPNLQAVLALGVLIVALLLHLVAYPYKVFHAKTCGGLVGMLHEQGPDLNQLETLSLLMSLLTFYSGVVFNDKNTSDTGRLTMTAVVTGLHILFILYMVIFRVWGGVHVAVDEKIKVLIFETNEVYDDTLFLPRKVVYLIKVWFRSATSRRSKGDKGRNSTGSP